MRTFRLCIILVALQWPLGEHLLPETAAQSSGETDIWVTGYYAGWMQGWENYGLLPAEEIDYSALTHIIHFGLVPRADGTLDSLSNSITEVNSRELLSRAHAAGVKVLLCIGGWGTDYLFRSATSPLYLSTFIDNLIDFMQRRGYDGLDIDWEYLASTDGPQYALFIRELRSQLDGVSPRPLLTAAVAWSPEVIALVASHFDQINIMTYDLSGAWPGWVAWHNSPIFDGGLVFPSTLRPVPSADGMVEQFARSGIPLGKLGIGIDFYGYVWTGGSGTPTGGVTKPGQTWITPPFARPNVPYFRIWEQFYKSDFYRWDSLAQAPYLSIDSTGSLGDRFISFCDETSCREKVEYARTKGIGGVFVWELGGGYLPKGNSDRDRLLQAIKNAVRGTPARPFAPLLVAPPNGSKDVSRPTRLAWQSPSSNQSLTYRLQIFNDHDLHAAVVDDSTIRQVEFIADLAPEEEYFWRVAARNESGWGSFSPLWSFRTSSEAPLIPSTFALHQNFPNPFNSETWIGVDLPVRCYVVLEIFSVVGEKVATLVNGVMDAGFHRIPWVPQRATSGVYFYHVRVQEIASPQNLNSGSGRMAYIK